MDKLLALKEQLINCKQCSLHKNRTNMVFGVGVETSKVMFIGEGPGHNEDIAGEPFVGRSGQLLDKYLDAINLSRDKNIYIANIVKCRPPSNRDPLPEEQDKCYEYLNQQIKIIHPKLIVCLGRIAAGRIIGKDFKVTRDHGKWYNSNFDCGAEIMGTFHPASLLRNPSQKEAAFSDFLSLRDKLTHN